MRSIVNSAFKKHQLNNNSALLFTSMNAFSTRFQNIYAEFCRVSADGFLRALAVVEVASSALRPRAPPRRSAVLAEPPHCWGHRSIGQILEGSFSAVSKPNVASKYAFESSRRDLRNALLCTALKSHFFKTSARILPKNCEKFQKCC